MNKKGIIAIVIGIAGVVAMIIASGHSARVVQAELQAAQEAAVEAATAQRAAERLAEIRTQYMTRLREYLAYPNGYFIDNRVVYILTIEDNYPVIKQIDIFEGEVIIKSEEKLDNFLNLAHGERLFSSSSRYGFLTFHFGRFENLYAGGIFGRNFRHSLRFVEKVDEAIPAEVLWLTMDGLVPLTGIFAFDGLQIYHKYNYEISKEYLNREIHIFLQDDGLLTGENFPSVRDFTLGDNFRFRPERFSSDGRRKMIIWGGANGPFGGVSYEWYFADTDTIYFRYTFRHHPFDFDTGASLPGGRSISFTVRYLRLQDN